MSDPPRIYMDNAATSWPKPQAVYEAVDQYQRQIGASAGRSAYCQANEAARLLQSTRRQLAELVGAEEKNRIIFTFNGTDSLNLALLGVVRPGDHVVTSVLEHNSVLRPLRYLETSRGIEVTRLPCDAQGVADPDAFRRAIRPNTRLFALVQASNVTGALQPVREVGQIARQSGIQFLVDAAQSLGHIPVDVRQLQCDLLASSGHKGLLGPLGTGVLYVAPGVEEHLDCLRMGGTGTESEQDRQPLSLPDKYESGNFNMPGIAGLGAALGVLADWGIGRIRQHEQLLLARLLDGLGSVTGVTIYGPADPARQVCVVSISVSGYDPQEIAAMLEVTANIQVRAGLHCAPRMHEALGTANAGGTVRLSLGLFNDEKQVDEVIRAVAQLACASQATGASLAAD